MTTVTRRISGFLTIVVLWSISAFAAEEKFSERLAVVMHAAKQTDRLTVWVSFRDKGSQELRKSSIPLDIVSERALARRRNVLPPDQIVDPTDLPVDESYVARLVSAGASVRHRSKWLNAASIVATPAVIQLIATFGFVESIEPVERWKHFPDREAAQTAPRPSPPSLRKESGTDDFSYGLSDAQVRLLNIPAVHNTGNYAQGVIICLMDNGFRLLSHEVFDSLKILATYDFVDKKVNVAPNNPDPGFGSHGVNTLSTIGGFKPGVLIGPAFGATYILARTENDSSGNFADFYPSEEDNWIAAVEWAESLGVQVTSTSLGYLEHLPPNTSFWTWRDMNGTTTPISRAATIAARKGVVVVNSAGNNGVAVDSTQNTLNAPADADSILTVGAVTPSGLRAGFSSVGPTTSIPPRIKPEVMATGTDVIVASGISPTGYGTSQGTSFSCPLAAGIAALILKAHPRATPMQVIEAMKMTANNATSPNNHTGWGTIDAVAALDYMATLDTGGGTHPSTYLLRQNFPNPFNPATTITYDLAEGSVISLKVYDVLGREVRTLVSGAQPAGRYLTTWRGETNSGAIVASGVYFYRLDIQSSSGRHAALTRKMVLVR
jgi:subtilisin family serine protease